ncbi:MAG TPA: 30S ribosomal protein S1 [Bacillota bacterium]|nr:30S ribosomal protein S1 [Bacillota bacterium]
MQIIMASPTGMCFGVRRALQKAEELAASGGYALGPVVHNAQVMGRLLERGLKVAAANAGPDQIPPGSNVLIRAHGAGPDTYTLAAEQGWVLDDATCTFVKRLQDVARRLLDDGCQVVLVGDSGHPEVVAVQQHAAGLLVVVRDAAELETVELADKVAVIAQTTTSPVTWQKVIECIRTQGKEVIPSETICAATEERQRAVYDLAAKVDIMVVVGGKNSANTRNLAKVSEGRGIPTYQVETPDQLNPAWFAGVSVAGVAAGASTPEWIIEEVVVAMEKMKEIIETNEVKEQEKTQEELEQVEQAAAPAPAEEVPAEEATAAEPTAETVEAAVKTVQPVEETPVEEVAAVTDEVVVEATEAVKEEVQTMAQAMEAMPDIESEVPVLKRGQSVEGKVVSVEEDGVYVNIGHKTDAYIAKNELSSDPNAVVTELVAVGDVVSAVVIRIDNKEDKVFLSRRRAAEEQGLKSIMAAREEDKILQGKVVEAVKGGVMVELMGLRAFMPASHVDLRYVPDLTAYVGQTVSVVIKEIEENRRRVVVSRKEALERKTEEIKEQMWDKLSEGEMREGVVQRLTDFGAFVDLGGLDGLVHVSEISWSRVNHPSEVLSEGQTVKVKILGLDQDRGRISLSIKQAEGDPWSRIGKSFSAGQVVDGKVMRTAGFGAFVEIAPGIEGLVHISQLSYERVEKTEDAVNPGDDVKVKILSISPEDHRVSLSIKETMERPAFTPRDDFRPERSDRRGGGGGGGRSQGYREESKVTLGDMFGALLKEKEDKEEKDPE